MCLKVAGGWKNFVASWAGDLLLFAMIVVDVISEANGLIVAFRTEVASEAPFTVMNVSNVHLQGLVQAVALSTKAGERLQTGVLMLQVNFQAHRRGKHGIALRARKIVFEFLWNVDVNEMRLHFVFPVAREWAVVALELLDVQVFLPDVHRQGIVSANTFTAVGADSHLGSPRNIAVRVVDVLLVQDYLEVGVR